MRAMVGFNGGSDLLGLKELKADWHHSFVASFSLSWKLEVARRLEHRGVCIKASENDNAISSSSELMKSKRDLTSLPKPLTADISTSDHVSNKRVAFQGLPGTFSESAALTAYPKCETVPCENFEVAFKAVEHWLVNKAVLPIENAFSGSIHQNYDLLLSHKLHIVGEVQLAVNYCLMALPGVREEDLKRVLSHPLALAHCRTALDKLNVVQENTDDTAAAALYVSSNGLKDAGAIASSRAASIYGLNILEEGIQVKWSTMLLLGNSLYKVNVLVQELIDAYIIYVDKPKSATRFLILAREPIIPRTDRRFKTSIVFTVEEGPGSIFKALSVFAVRNINLTKIESRPQKKQPLRVIDGSDNGAAMYFDYLFYIDFEASMAERRAQNALAHLQEYATFIRVLGSFPMDRYS